MKILCSGDLHLGRRSSRLPKVLGNEVVDGHAHSCAAVWTRIVDLALEEAVDVVALSGDLVDDANRFYEAIGPLEAGVRRLASSGIKTVAVAGNHDHDVLPHLAQNLDPKAFRLLGRGGRWERETVRRGDSVIHIDGWSFPRQYVRENPVREHTLPSGEDGPVLGLLHADLGHQVESPYAPVTHADLRARPVDFWLLGHIHAPMYDEGSGHAPILYPGSPQAMDPGETGMHGAWIIEVEAGRQFRARHVPLSTVRYDVVEVDVTGAEEPAEIDGRIVEAVRAHRDAIEERGPLRLAIYRVRVVGRTPSPRRLDQHLSGASVRELQIPGDEVTALIEDVDQQTRPAYDLDELAQGNDPVGVLARLILELDSSPHASDTEPSGADESGVAQPEPVVAGTGAPGTAESDVPALEVEALLRAAEKAAVDVDRARAYHGLEDSAWTTGPSEGARSGDGTARLSARGALVRQATRLLDLLLAQKEET